GPAQCFLSWIVRQFEIGACETTMSFRSELNVPVAPEERLLMDALANVSQPTDEAGRMPVPVRLTDISWNWFTARSACVSGLSAPAIAPVRPSLPSLTAPSACAGTRFVCVSQHGWESFESAHGVLLSVFHFRIVMFAVPPPKSYVIS